MANRRHTIGLLVATITDEFSNRLAIGAMEAARALDANLIIFPGKYVGVQEINEQYGAKYEYQYNALFDIAAKAELDYLIVAVGTIGFALDREKRLRFLDRFQDTPNLSVTLEVEGRPFLQFDDCSGLSAAVDYLAAHGRKHIGMMVGDLTNEGFVKRYETYRQRLEANGLAFHERYVMPSNLAVHCFPEIEALLDRNPELDAVLCTTDIIAADLCKVLKQRGVRIGTDIAVVGFDDLPIDARLDPPLASVRADAVKLGQRAVEKAVHYLDGVADEACYLGSQFIPRQSCFRYVDDQNLAEALFCDDFPTLIGRIREHFGKTDDRRAGDLILSLLEHLRQRYVHKPADESAMEDTISLLRQASALPETPDMDRLLDGAYVWLMRNCHAGSIPYVRALLPYFRANQDEDTVESVTQRFLNRSHDSNVFIRDALMFSGNLKDSYALILERLGMVGALSAFLYTFDQPITYRYGDAFPDHPAWRFQSYSRGEEVFSAPKDEPLLSTPELFHRHRLRQDGPFILVATALYSAETQYGLALFEPKDKDFFEGLELVTFQLSSAVRTLDILKKQEELLAKQEKLLDELHTSNLALEKISKIDELTRVYNRKGFYPAADQLINDPRHQGQPLIICYADMDNLKTVNDTYGHAEGDHAIQLVAQCLAYALGDGAVIGRMGGDEFAAILPPSPDVTVETLRARKEQFIQRFNDAKEKPYRFDVSMGLIECVCGDSYDLKAALDKADDLLYVEKSAKKKK